LKITHKTLGAAAEGFAFLLQFTPMRQTAFLIAAGLILPNAAYANTAQKGLVIIPIADVRSDCTPAPEGKSDNKQQTQILFGESVEVIGSDEKCFKVRATEQLEYSTGNRWEGYPGWVDKSALVLDDPGAAPNYVVTAKWLPVAAATKGPQVSRLPAGAKVRVTSQQKGWASIDLFNGLTGWVPANGLGRIAPATNSTKLRRRILQTASEFIGDPYVWGGLSPLDSTHQIRLTGLDCSGLVHLSYRVNGVTIPRDSLEQFMKARSIRRAQLKPGDLIFSA
jgi:gamma-D-glutamyl-L-lysine dipeptidyl-peptidase